MLILSVWAACSAARWSTPWPVQRLLYRVREEVAGRRAFTMLTVSPSIPADAPRAPSRRLLHAGQAGVDALDRGVRLLTSTSTTSSSLLLSAMKVRSGPERGPET